jgi:hypothetical protein
LWCFFCLFVWFALVWFGFFPLWWDNDRTTSETPSPGLEAEGLTPKLLRLKLYCIWTWRFLNYFYFYFISFFSQSSLCLSNACSAYYWLVHYLSLLISLKFFCFSLYFFYLFVFPSFFNFFAFPLLSPFHSKYHHCYYYELENT